MIRHYLFLLSLLILATAEIPCRLYDVTTLVRLSKKASALRQGVSGVSQFEVHSRTNAVGLPVQFELPDWYKSFKDPLQNSNLTCIFNSTDLRPGWATDGFTFADWFEDDPLFNWERPHKELGDKEEKKALIYIGRNLQERCKYGNSLWSKIESTNPRTAFYSLGKDQAIKFRFRPGDGLKLFIGLMKYDGDEKIKSGSGNGPIDNDGEDDDSDEDAGRREDDSNSSHGFEFTYLSNSSTMFEEKRFEKSAFYFHESIIGHQGIVPLHQPDAVVTVYVAKNDDGHYCLWIENTKHPTYSNKKCLLVLNSRNNMVMIVSETVFDHFSLSVYRASLKLSALRESRDFAYIRTPELKPGRKAGLCVSLRYYLREGRTAHFRFLPVVNDTLKEEIKAVSVQGVGKPVSTQFELIKPKWLRKQNWSLRIEFTNNGTFILHSMRQCSGKDRDDVIVPLKLSVSQTTVNGRNGNERLLSSDGALEGFTMAPKNGLGLTCAHEEITFPKAVTKCYNGGVNVEGLCQCFPGFTGPLCEKACPPERFGGDCGGSCNALGKHDCVGILMAAPGSKLQCARGYYGPQCDQRCKKGFYGQDCLLKCGHCAGDTCNRYTGLCYGSCESGYAGPSCDTEVPSIYRLVNITTGFNFVGGYLNITLSDETISHYPFIEMRYKHLQWPFKESKKLLPLTSKTPFVRIDRLKHGQRYQIYAVLVHKSGHVYDGEVSDEETDIVETDCNDSIVFTDVDVDPLGESLCISWNVTENDTYPCPKVKYNIEIDSEDLEETIIEEAEPNDNQKTLTTLLPSEGTVRLRAIYLNKEGEWSDPYPFSNKIVTEKPSVLKVVNKTSRMIELFWSTSDDSAHDIIMCKVEAMLCRGTSRGNVVKPVQEGTVILQELYPFSVYTCTLDGLGTTISTMTEPEIPSGAPQRHSAPVISIKNTSATIQWLDPECFDINGLNKGFRVMLYSEGKLVNVSDVSDDNAFSVEDNQSYRFENLEPETEYEAKVLVLNHVGVNPKYPLTIGFKTKSKHPETVRNLVVYKRTKNDLWLRWSEPEDFTFIAGSSPNIADDFKVITSSPGLESKSEEIPMTRCRTWPDYFCHRVRSLIPNKEYTVSVLSRDSIQKMYGPVSQVNATTTEGVPDPPRNLQILNKTAHSIVVSWEIPLMLNSNPRYFMASVEQSLESGSQESDPPLTKIPISDGVQLYQAKFDNLIPASTYTVTVGASMNGGRATLMVHTPPLDPPPPSSPNVTYLQREISVRGVGNSSDIKYLSGYFLLVSSNGSKSDPAILDKELQALLQMKFSENFHVVKEYPPSLQEDTFTYTPSDSFSGNFSIILRKPLSDKHSFAMAAFSNYSGSYSASVSDPTPYDPRTILDETQENAVDRNLPPIVTEVSRPQNQEEKGTT